MSDKPTTNKRSRDFRHVFANTFGFVFGQNEVQLIGGIQLNPGTDDPEMEEQIGLVVTHPAAKLMASALMVMIKNYEEVTGKEIPLDLSKIQKIEDAIAEARAAQAKKAAELAAQKTQ